MTITVEEFEKIHAWLIADAKPQSDIVYMPLPEYGIKCYQLYLHRQIKTIRGKRRNRHKII